MGTARLQFTERFQFHRDGKTKLPISCRLNRPSLFHAINLILHWTRTQKWGNILPYHVLWNGKKMKCKLICSAQFRRDNASDRETSKFPQFLSIEQITSQRRNPYILTTFLNFVSSVHWYRTIAFNPVFALPSASSDLSLTLYCIVLYSIEGLVIAAQCTATF